jgi:kynurenine formamidase
MPLTREFQILAAQVRNWGRWGADDQLGTLNFITPEVVATAAACVRHGRTIPLAVPLEQDGVQAGFVPGRDNPTLTMHAVNEPLDPGAGPGSFHTSDDHVTMGLQAGTHWDGLGHASYSGQMYNGFDAATITDKGASRCGIHHLRSVVSRGVLLDVARAKGVDVLDCPYAITAADLDEAASLANLQVRSGDIVLVRTGRMAIYHQSGGLAYCLGPNQDGSNAGMSMSSVAWLHNNDIAAVANDTLAFEVYPSESDALAIHLLHLVDMGLTQGQNWDLEALSVDCATDGVYEFLLCATPEPFVNAVGSPVAPVAIK